METIAAILFGIGVAGSTTLAVLTVCLIGTRHKQKRLIALDKQRKATRDFWNTYWATCVTAVSLCTASRNACTSENFQIVSSPGTLIEQDKWDVTGEFDELEKHKIIIEN